MSENKGDLWFSVHKTENNKNTIFIEIVSEKRAIIEKFKEFLSTIKDLNTEDLKLKFSENISIVELLIRAIDGYNVDAKDISDIGFNSNEGHHVTFILREAH